LAHIKKNRFKVPTRLRKKSHLVRDFRGLIPNGLSMINLVFGFLSIVNSIEGNFLNAGFFIFIGIISDNFDGKMARRLNATSDMGAQFDSMADLVTFGVASSVLLYEAVLRSIPNGVFYAVIGVACTALRLARFNVKSDINYFEGIPSPAFGYFAAAFVISGIYNYIPNKISLGLIVVSSFLMVSTIKYPTFKKTKPTKLYLYGLIFVILLVLSYYNKQIIILPFLLYVIGGPFILKWTTK